MPSFLHCLGYPASSAMHCFIISPISRLFLCALASYSPFLRKNTTILIISPNNLHYLVIADATRMLNGGHGVELRQPLSHSMNAPGPQTFDHQYMPFAGGFAHMSDEAKIYRSTRLNAINPTAAVSDDISFYYTLDSGRVPPAAVAANPERSAEFVRNTPTKTHGGVMRSLMRPIK